MRESVPQRPTSGKPDLWFLGELVACVARVPDHSPAALEAVALVGAGRASATRSEFVRHLVREPAMAQPWLRDLVHRLR